MHRRPLPTLVLLAALVPLSAHALTPDQIDATRGLRTLSKRLASRAFGGRDKTTRRTRCAPSRS
jgi:hypothetical protein